MKHSCYILLVLLLVYSCKEPEARRPKKHSVTNFHKEVIAQYKKLNALEKDRIEYIISKDTIYKYKPSMNGFWYAYISKDSIGVNLSPKEGDLVTLEYDIATISNTLVYAKKEISYKVDKQDFIPGLQEGIKLMKEGEKISFIIPSYRAYGIVGDGNKVKINQPIKSTLKLIKIIKNNENK